MISKGMSLLRQATEGPQSSSSFSVRGAEVGKFGVRWRVWWAELVMVALNKTRKQPSTIGPRQEKERNWSSTRPIYNTFLYLPFVMSDIFEGLFAKHLHAWTSLIPATLCEVCTVRSLILTCGKCEVQAGEITTKGTENMWVSTPTSTLCVFSTLCAQIMWDI